jgi:hypothetical protein
MANATQGLVKIPLVRWAMRHPRVAAWIVLSVGMVILLVIEARNIGLLPTQWLALVVACVLVAGACIWIVSWEDSDEEAETTEQPASKGAAVVTPPPNTEQKPDAS